MDTDENDGFLPGFDDDDEMNPDINDEISVKSQELNEPDTSMLKSYEDYVQYSLINNMPLNKDELRAIRLVSTLRATAASLETYDRIMELPTRKVQQVLCPAMPLMGSCPLTSRTMDGTLSLPFRQSLP